MTEPKPYQNLRDEILDVASTHYDLSSDNAGAYLNVLRRAQPDDQIRLFELVLTNHDARQHRRQIYKSPHSMKEKDWRQIAERLSDMVDGWAEEILIANRPSRETAGCIWDRLQQLELPMDKVVALGILLHNRAIPYAQLPADFLTVVPRDVLWAARDRAATTVALISRLFASKLSPLQTASALAHALATITDRDETVACLEFILQIAQRAGGGIAGLPGISLASALVNPDQLRHLLRHAPPGLREALGLPAEEDEEED